MSYSTLMRLPKRKHLKDPKIVISLVLVAVALVSAFTIVAKLSSYQKYKSIENVVTSSPQPVPAQTENETTQPVVEDKPKEIEITQREPQPTGSKTAAPVISKINTTQPVVFLTIDDGGTKKEEMLGLLKANNLKATLFLANSFISSNYTFFNQFVEAGMTVQNHSISHNYAKPGKYTYEEQKQEICGMNTIIQQKYGKSPSLYRPPGGWMDDNTTTAASACGMRAVVMWSAKVNGGAVQYQVGSSFRPGDIVLMHFRPEFEADLNAFIAAKDAAGLQTDYLEKWLD